MLNSPIASSLATQAWIDSKRILERQISILEFADISDRAVAVKEFRYIMGGTVLLFHFVCLILSCTGGWGQERDSLYLS